MTRLLTEYREAGLGGVRMGTLTLLPAPASTAGESGQDVIGLALEAHGIDVIRLDEALGRLLFCHSARRSLMSIIENPRVLARLTKRSTCTSDAE